MRRIIYHMTENNLSNNIDFSKLPDDQILGQSVNTLNTGDNNNGSNKSLTQEEANKLFNIPKRDTERYPLPTKNELETAGNFLMKMNSMASAYDGNLFALIWQFYKDLVIYLRAKDTKAEQIVNMVGKLDAIKTYLKESKNPMLG